eukprot:TRINITY_DN16825_c0_g2_i1.p1 TRINITY_DN16825_c0_g2~~TRINITY_DN16825_c0_g2_i1.p1  ORF type:complete len:522 (+),score=133.81 TRINITY_DN16825_c0_g2_i1:73-1638(+)
MAGPPPVPQKDTASSMLASTAAAVSVGGLASFTAMAWATGLHLAYVLLLVILWSALSMWYFFEAWSPGVISWLAFQGLIPEAKAWQQLDAAVDLLRRNVLDAEDYARLLRNADPGRRYPPVALAFAVDGCVPDAQATKLADSIEKVMHSALGEDVDLRSRCCFGTMHVLNCVNLSAKGLRQILHAPLSFNKMLNDERAVLRTLTLDGCNSLGDAGMDMFVQLLTVEAKDLERMSLVSCGITQGGITALSTAASAFTPQAVAPPLSPDEEAASDAGPPLSDAAGAGVGDMEEEDMPQPPAPFGAAAALAASLPPNETAPPPPPFGAAPPPPPFGVDAARGGSAPPMALRSAPGIGLKVLQLSANDLSGAGRSLAVLLRSLPNLIMMGLEDCKLSAEDMQQLAKALPRSEARRLDLASNGFGDKGLLAIAAGLRKSKIHDLGLERNGIGPPGGAALTALKESYEKRPFQLAGLRLYGNDMTDEQLAEYMGSLQPLYLASLGKAGPAMFCAAGCDCFEGRGEVM